MANTVPVQRWAPHQQQQNAWPPPQQQHQNGPLLPPPTQPPMQQSSQQHQHQFSSAGPMPPAGNNHYNPPPVHQNQFPPPGAGPQQQQHQNGPLLPPTQPPMHQSSQQHLQQQNGQLLPPTQAPMHHSSQQHQQHFSSAGPMPPAGNNYNTNNNGAPPPPVRQNQFPPPGAGPQQQQQTPGGMGKGMGPPGMGPPGMPPSGPMGAAPPPGYGMPPPGAGPQQQQTPGGMGMGMGQQPPGMGPPGMGPPGMGPPVMGPPGMGPPGMGPPVMGPPGMGPPGMGPPVMGPPGMPGMPPTPGGMGMGMGQQPPGMGPPGMGPPGMPPSGPMGAAPPGVGGYPQPGYGMPPAGPAQPAKRLDASMMPSAIQVMEDDRNARSGLFQTGYPRAELPPLATTEFFAEDQGNCNPKFMRASTYAVPVGNDMVKQCSVPIALAINPLAAPSAQERPPPVVNLGQLGPVRCHRCKAYMCPFMEFNDGGRRFRCPFCKANSEVPQEYFAHLDHTGRRVDIYERPELCLGSYEFVATTEYCKNGIIPKAPAFIFLIDVSYNSVRNGIVKLICENIKRLLANLPKDVGEERSEIRVGFATYDQSVHFYNLKSAVGQPAMLIVNDVQDMFVPLVDGFLVAPWEAETAIDYLLQQIPNNFADTKVTEVILGPVIQAGVDALKASDRPGKLFIFHSSLPLFEAPGKLKNRDDRKLLGTDKEKTILTPASEFYSKLGAECVSAGCSVDMFMFPNAYVDIATIGCLCGTTGGQLYKYQYFQPDIDGERFLRDLKHDLERPIVFDAIMRVRTSTGLRPTDFFGSFYMSNSTDVELGTLDSEKTITVELKHDDKLDEDGAFVQAALLFTSVGGHRRLRIHNLSLSVAQDLAALYRSVDLFATVNYLSKLGERGVLQKSPREVRETLTKTCAQILSAYRQHCSPSSSLGQLVLPEGMKLLPLFINCIIKHDAFVGGSEVTVDDRAWLMQAVPSMRVVDTVYYFYPRLVQVTNMEGDDDLPPAPLRCSYENMAPNSAYLLENGVLIFLWIGGSVEPQWVQDVFGVQGFGQINGDKHELPEKDNGTSRKLRKMISKMQQERPRSMKLFLIKQQDKLEPWFKRYLVEDRSSAGADSTPSYVDFLVHIHNEIREMLTR